ncbi:M67 family metallopeptidase [Thauera sp. Sel9]|uniref:M67 family metallopeptidase n=1 Tax=Thauera sp. Sel9 TaxID=2974299 RepID=UPI0021E184C8|nr:M67 family metallopeptidase [Thauera sp. Sel9]MCV2219020.1 M67 family metallopeptidase [Thauera sp. Sel9]
MALHIRHQVLEQILAQARRDHPLETCGIVSSAPGSTVASRLVPMRNQAASETFFQFDSREQFRVFRELAERDEACRVIYHSHTASEAYPSREDIEYAHSPEAHYLIVSTWDAARVPVRSFRLCNGSMTEESISILE